MIVRHTGFMRRLPMKAELRCFTPARPASRSDCSGAATNARAASSPRRRAMTQAALGASFELEADELLAVCVQHEMDHLLGKVFVEHLSELKQNRIRAKLKKRQRKAA